MSKNFLSINAQGAYVAPRCEALHIQCEDIIAVSGSGNADGGTIVEWGADDGIEQIIDIESIGTLF